MFEFIMKLYSGWDAACGVRCYLRRFHLIDWSVWIQYCCWTAVLTNCFFFWTLRATPMKHLSGWWSTARYWFPYWFWLHSQLWHMVSFNLALSCLFWLMFGALYASLMAPNSGPPELWRGENENKWISHAKSLHSGNLFIYIYSSKAVLRFLLA